VAVWDRTLDWSFRIANLFSLLVFSTVSCLEASRLSFAILPDSATRPIDGTVSTADTVADVVVVAVAMTSEVTVIETVL